MFGSRHSCLEFRSRDGVRTLALHFLSLCVRGLEFARHRALLSTCVLLFCTQFVFLSAVCIYVYLVLCGTQLVYLLAVCFHVVMSCVNTWLMSFLISCVFMSCFAHGW